jgi:hypothetical protein
MSMISSELSEQAPTQVRGNGFCIESGAVMQRLRTSVSEMLKTIPNRVRTTRDLQKVFNVDVKLCWQMLKLTGPGDALSLAPFVPTPGPMKRFLAAAKSAGIDRQVIERINAAYEAFNEQVQIHAGDRPTFEAMVSGAAGINENSSEDLQKQAIRLRKSAFQTVSHYAGCGQSADQDGRSPLAGQFAVYRRSDQEREFRRQHSGLEGHVHQGHIRR